MVMSVCKSLCVVLMVQDCGHQPAAHEDWITSYMDSAQDWGLNVPSGVGLNCM